MRKAASIPTSVYQCKEEYERYLVSWAEDGWKLVSVIEETAKATGNVTLEFERD